MSSKPLSAAGVHVVGWVNLSSPEDVLWERAQHVVDLVAALPDRETSSRVRCWRV